MRASDRTLRDYGADGERVSSLGAFRAFAGDEVALAASLGVEIVAVNDTASDLGERTRPFLPMHQVQELCSAVHGFPQWRRQPMRTC